MTSDTNLPSLCAEIFRIENTGTSNHVTCKFCFRKLFVLKLQPSWRYHEQHSQSAGSLKLEKHPDLDTKLGELHGIQCSPMCEPPSSSESNSKSTICASRLKHSRIQKPRIADNDLSREKLNLKQRAKKLHQLPRYLILAVEEKFGAQIPIPQLCNTPTGSFLDWDGWLKLLLSPRYWSQKAEWMGLVENVLEEYELWKSACQLLGYKVPDHCSDINFALKENVSISSCKRLDSQDAPNQSQFLRLVKMATLLSNCEVREALVKIALAVVLVRCGGREPHNGCVFTLNRRETAKLSSLAVRMYSSRASTSGDFKLSLGFLVDAASALHILRASATCGAVEELYSSERKRDVAESSFGYSMNDQHPSQVEVYHHMNVPEYENALNELYGHIRGGKSQSEISRIGGILSAVHEAVLDSQLFASFRSSSEKVPPPNFSAESSTVASEGASAELMRTEVLVPCSRDDESQQFVYTIQKCNLSTIHAVAENIDESIDIFGILEHDAPTWDILDDLSAYIASVGAYSD